MIVELIGVLLASAQASAPAAPAAPVPPAQAAPPPKLTTIVLVDAQGEPIEMPVGSSSADAPHLLNLGEVFSSDDYPADALKSGAQGTVIVEVAIDGAGRPASCRIGKSSGVASLDKTSCALIMTRGKFNPAKAGATTALRTLSLPVRWLLPLDVAMPFADLVSDIRFVVGADKTITGCRWVVSRPPEGMPQLPEAIICQSAKRMAESAIVHFKPHLPAVPFTLVLSKTQLIGGPEGASTIGRGTGQQLLAEDAIAVAIDADGKVTSCEPIESDVDIPPGPDLCDLSTKSRFEPLTKGAADRSARHIVLSMAIYTAPLDRVK